MTTNIFPERHGWHAWFAWHAVTTLGGNRVWLKSTERRWNPEINFTVLTSWDPGDYDGGWEYRLPKVKP